MIKANINKINNYLKMAWKRVTNPIAGKYMIAGKCIYPVVLCTFGKNNK